MTEKWHKVCSTDDLDMDDVMGVTVEDKLIAVYQIKSGFYATDGQCSHELADMTNGYVEGDFIECPKHNARFSIVNGQALRRPACEGIKTYPVKVEGSDIFVKVMEE